MKPLKIILSFSLFFGNLTLKATNILIDGIHGWSITPSDLFEVGNPEELFPEFEFDLLTADDFPIETVLTAGTITTNYDTITYEVPLDASVLYLRYQLSPDPDGDQHPYIYMVDPNGNLAAHNTNGFAYVEDPIAGIWTLYYSAWDSLTTTYEIGTGPHFYTAERLVSYDIILQMRDNTYALFVGYIPELSEFELSQLEVYFTAGSGYLLLRETDWIIVLKPIIHLYAQEQLAVNISLKFPGEPTYLYPKTTTQARVDNIAITWLAQFIHPHKPIELGYEGRFPSGLNYLSAQLNGNTVFLKNHAPFTLSDLHLFQFVEGQGFRYGFLKQLDLLMTANIDFSTTFTTMQLVDYMTNQLLREAQQNGLTDKEAQEFYTRYQWVLRWLQLATQSGGLCVIYHFSDENYDRFIPVESSINPSESVRVMWVFAENLPAQITGKPFDLEIITRPNSLTIDTESSLRYHEYGVIEERYPRDRFGQREVDFFGLQFMDALITDPTNNYNGDPWRPVFHTFADNPIAQSLSAGVSQVQAFIAAPILIDTSEGEFAILIGDDDTACDDTTIFPPGSFPPVAAGKEITNGRLIGINDIHILSDNLDNPQFLRNCFNWLAPVQTGIVIHVPEDVPAIQAGIDSTSNGDTVLVAPGTYFENINFRGKDIVLKSSGGYSVTTIQPPDTGSVVKFLNGERAQAQLDGFTITGGYTFTGGGILIRGASPIIKDNLITLNHAGDCGGEGGGIAVRDSSRPLIINNTIFNNDAAGLCDCVCYFGGGIYIDASSNPIIGGSPGFGNNIYENWGDYGNQLFYAGTTAVIDARYNYFGGDCPPDSARDVYPMPLLDLTGCSDSMLSVATNEHEPSLPNKLILHQNYPNPFNPVTDIRFELPEPAHVRLVVFDLLGREVTTLANGFHPSGFYQTKWEASNIANGIYFYQLISDNTRLTRKLVVLK